MADIKKQHPVYGEVTVLQSSSALVQVETENGDSFWVAASSFIKKKTKPRAKKKKVVPVVHRVDDPVDALLVQETRAEELKPEICDVEDVAPEGELEELENEEAEIAEDAA
jgi:hypothetical protein